jgi:hypothetical protein
MMAGAKGRSGGKNRKSRQMHIIQATFRQSRHTADAPDPPQGTPEAPGVLAGEAKAEWAVLSADASGHHGWRPHGVIIDELQVDRSTTRLPSVRSTGCLRNG